MPDLTPHQQSLLEEEVERIRAVRQRDIDAVHQQASEFEAHVQQIQNLRSEIDDRIGSIVAACNRLKSVVRRNPGELSRGYIVYINSHMRLAGLLQQALKRSAPADRNLERSAREIEADKVAQADREERALTRRAEKASLYHQAPPLSDVDDLFGPAEAEDG